MNEAQFDICKTMQACGVKAEKFAHAVHEPVALMKRVWAVATWDRFTSKVFG